MLNTLFIREALETMGVTTPFRWFWRHSRMNTHRSAKTNVYQRHFLIRRGRQRAHGRQVVGSWTDGARRSVDAPPSSPAAAGRHPRGGDCRVASDTCDG